MSQFYKDQYVKVVKHRECYDCATALAEEQGLTKWEHGALPKKDAMAIIKKVLFDNKIVIEELDSGRQFIVAQAALKAAPLSFEEDEPVVVVAGGWGLYPDLVGTIVNVKAVSVACLSKTYQFTLSRVTTKPGKYERQQAGTSFSGYSIRKLTSEERAELVVEVVPAVVLDKEDPRVIRVRIQELEATIVAAKREASALRDKLAEQGFALI